MADDKEIPGLEELLAKSRGTDIPVLLQAKELAKKAASKEASSANLAALKRASAMLDEAEAALAPEKKDQLTFKTAGDVLRYLQEERGRQIEKSKLYADVKKGLLRKEGRAFRQTDVDRYAGSLPLSTTPDGRNREAEERMRRKDEAEIRIKEATADREELKTAVMQGKYVLREQVDHELAARAVALNVGLKAAIEEAALDLVTKVGGKSRRSRLLAQELERLIDAACNEYAKDLEFEVQLGDDDDAADGDA